jgi:hypothetical protein
MTIYANNLVVNGSFNGTSLHANNIGAGSNAVLNVMSDIAVNGSVLSKGRLEAGSTMYMTMRVTSNVDMGANEHYIVNYDMILDPSASDPVSISAVADYTTIWNWMDGTFTVPVDGLYTLQMQGAFSNSVPDATNGVYYYFRNHAYPNARYAANLQKSPIVYSASSQYLLKGDVIQPTYYSTDSNSVILGNGESYLSFLIPSTVNVTHSNYVRL